jgi:hypothetical protein
VAHDRDGRGNILAQQIAAERIAVGSVSPEIDREHAVSVSGEAPRKRAQAHPIAREPVDQKHARRTALGRNREQVVERIVRSGPVLAAGHVEGRRDLPLQNHILMRRRPVLLGREYRNHREERRGGDRARESDPVAHPPTHDGLAPWSQAETDMLNRRD